MVTVDEFSRLVSGIYAAATTPGTGSGPFARFTARSVAIGGSLLSGRGTVWSFRTPRRCKPHLRATQSITTDLDHVLAAVEKRSGRCGAHRVGVDAPGAEVRVLSRLVASQSISRMGYSSGLTGGPRPTCSSLRRRDGRSRSTRRSV